VTAWFIIGCSALPLIYGIVIYNRLVRDRQLTRSGWSDIGIQLKRRHDLIPKLVDAVRQYAAFEQNTLEQVTALRRQAAAMQSTGRQSAGMQSPAGQSPLESHISRGLISIFALQEAYPDLKANQSFAQLQSDISTVEIDIQFARRYYNGAVRNLNTRIESFPDLLLAGLFGFTPAEYFEFEDSLTK
jgi:LemA protein